VCNFDQSEDRQCCYSFWIWAVVSFMPNIGKINAAKAEDAGAAIWKRTWKQR
jgi:hypothetical protein